MKKGLFDWAELAVAPAFKNGLLSTFAGVLEVINGLAGAVEPVDAEVDT